MSQKYFGKSQAEKEDRQEKRDPHGSMNSKDSSFKTFRGETEVNIAYHGDWKDGQKKQRDD